MNRPLQALKGIGPKKAELFARLGIATCGDLLRHFPRDYLDFSHMVPAKAAQGVCAVRVRLCSTPKVVRLGRGRTIVNLRAEDDSGPIGVVWFNQPYVAQRLAEGKTYCLCGRVERSEKGGARMINPIIAAGDAPPGILPVYSLCAGLSQNALRTAVQAALTSSDFGEDLFPADLRERLGLPSGREAFFALHCPQSEAQLRAARRRFALEDIVSYLLGMRLIAGGKERPGVAFQTAGTLERFCTLLPFASTGAQKNAMEEIAADMARPLAMNRLVQGDVGSGKTAVAFFALFVALENGRQSALLAPTEILARQHYEKARQMFPSAKIELLTGGMSAKARAGLYSRIASGEVQIVVGTHALLQEGLRFHDLALAVADEQHRFGVRQRAAIAEKGRESLGNLGSAAEPDVLVLSATPIPRSLSLVLFGDMQASVIGELPPGRKPVTTAIVPPKKRMAMYGYVAQKAGEGEQAYVVCPLVEESESLEVRSAEEVFEELKAGPLLGVPLGLLHGRMNAAAKEEVLSAFRAGQVKVLVSTTVVEVGVDVPNATIMVVESAERFGLAQLHQLRGRVGRGAKPASCYLLPGRDAAKESVDRLRLLCSTTDGFQIAMEDLRTRGPGAFLGTAQSGFADAGSIALLDGVETLEEGRKIADGIDTGGWLPPEERERMLNVILQKLSVKLEGIALN